MNSELLFVAFLVLVLCALPTPWLYMAALNRRSLGARLALTVGWLVCVFPVSTLLVCAQVPGHVPEAVCLALVVYAAAVWGAFRWFHPWSSRFWAGMKGRPWFPLARFLVLKLCWLLVLLLLCRRVGRCLLQLETQWPATGSEWWEFSFDLLPPLLLIPLGLCELFCRRAAAQD